MSDPRVRELQYKLAHGGEKFKLEVRGPDHGYPACHMPPRAADSPHS